MNGLPDHLALRFHLYLNVLPVAERVLMYCCFVVGAAFLVLAAYRAGSAEAPPADRAARKLSNFARERRPSLNGKELEVYIGRLMEPLEDEPGLGEFRETKGAEV